MSTIPSGIAQTWYPSDENPRETSEEPREQTFPLVVVIKHLVRVGAACRSRTDDLLITNQLLYQLS